MDKILRSAIDTWGEKNQILQAIEEMSELTTELSHHLRGRDNLDGVIEEISDVLITVSQMRILFGEDLCDRSVEHKLMSLNERIQNAARESVS